MVVAILVETGEVVDFEVLSMHCHECRKHQHEDKDSETYKSLKAKHESSCQINYKGSHLVVWKVLVQLRSFRDQLLIED